MPATIKAKDGRVLIFSSDAFVAEICLSEACFICGAAPGAKAFNGEHVLPWWLLKRYDLFQRNVTLHDGQIRTYGQYKLPCCIECNSLLGRDLETPVSKLLEGDYATVMDRLDKNGATLLFQWLCLVFLKTHLKDRSVPQNPNPKLSEGWLSDDYDWARMHHLHNFARAVFSGATIDWDAVGTVFVFEVADTLVTEPFDYFDLTSQATIGMRLGNLGIVAVLNDAGAAHEARAALLEKIDGPLSVIQLREAAAYLATANHDLINRPIFSTMYAPETDAVRITALLGFEFRFAPFDRARFGEAFAFLARDLKPLLSFDLDRDPDAAIEAIKAGKLQFLFDENGRFRPAVVIEAGTKLPE